MSASQEDQLARLSAPAAHPEPGWVPVVPFPSPEGTFLHEGDRVRLAYFRNPQRPELYAKAWFGTKTMGPPGHVHGGAMAAALDEAMGAKFTVSLPGCSVLIRYHFDYEAAQI